jgi:hypothetical protein
MSTEQLKIVFETYCNFGVSRDNLSITGGQLDNAKFAKLCRDSKIISKTGPVTSTDVDITFNKVKAKNDRKINFEAFCSALKILAELRFKSTLEEGARYLNIIRLVTETGGPAVKGTVAESTGIVSKMTDVNLYTGSHKNRFNADGTGNGRNGVKLTQSKSSDSLLLQPKGINYTLRMFAYFFSEFKFDTSQPKPTLEPKKKVNLKT